MIDRGQPGNAHRPLHPYTIGLLQTIPRLGRRVKERLLPIPGSAPDPFSVPQGCAFRPRCPVTYSGCDEPARMIEAGSGHEVRCSVAIDALAKSQALSAALVLKAPADGTVLEQMVTVGQRLDALTPIYKIGRLDPLWLEIYVAVGRAAGVRDGAPVSVPSADARGRIISVGRGVDPDSQTVMLRALITENTRNLRTGQNVEVAVAGVDTGTETAWRVPNEALARQGGKVYVFVRSPTGFTPLPVRLLQEGPRDTGVAGPLTERSEIAVTGTSALKARMMGLGGNQ